MLTSALQLVDKREGGPKLLVVSEYEKAEYLVVRVSLPSDRSIYQVSFLKSAF